MSADAERSLEHPELYSNPFKLIDVRKGKESSRKLSKANIDEAFAVINEIRSLTNSGVKAQSIKVITPYIGQRDLIKASRT